MKRNSDLEIHTMQHATSRAISCLATIAFLLCASQVNAESIVIDDFDGTLLDGFTSEYSGENWLIDVDAGTLTSDGPGSSFTAVYTSSSSYNFEGGQSFDVVFNSISGSTSDSGVSVSITLGDIDDGIATASGIALTDGVFNISTAEFTDVNLAGINSITYTLETADGVSYSADSFTDFFIPTPAAAAVGVPLFGLLAICRPRRREN